MKITEIATAWYPKGVYLQYLSTNSPVPLSPKAQLQISYNPQDISQGLSFLALDMESQQLMTIAPDGRIQRYRIKVA